jgi:hypothetical protein
VAENGVALVQFKFCVSPVKQILELVPVKHSSLTSTRLAMFPPDAAEDSHIWLLSLDDERECSRVDLGLFEQTCIVVAPQVYLRMQSRLDSCSHFLQRLEGESGYVVAEHAQQCVLYCQSGELRLPERGVRLAENGVYVLDEVVANKGIAFAWSATDGAQVYLVRVGYFS